MNFDLYKSTVFLSVGGSHAYGMATPSSDYDYRGIAIAPLNSYIGLLDKFEQAVDGDKGAHVYKHFPVGFLQTDPRVLGADQFIAPDMQIMELSKFVRLALSNNPSVLETLFTDESEQLIVHPIMKELISNRDKMLSKQAKARFCGYAVSQLNRIKHHKRWLDNPPTHKPTREEFGLPEQTLVSQDQIGAANTLIQREIDEFMVDQTHLPEDVKIELTSALGRSMRAVWLAINTNNPYPVGEDQRFETTEDALYWGAAKDQGFSENFLEVLVREKRYRTAKREWDQYQTWLSQRNEKRAALEAKFGFDTKHASHLVRLMRMAREILVDHKVLVKRPDAEELLAIRSGAWSYEQIVEFAETEDLVLNEVVKTCTLPKVPDMNFFDNLVREMILEFNRK
jgi:predicted nucleotidyltransferase